MSALSDLLDGLAVASRRPRRPRAQRRRTSGRPGRRRPGGGRAGGRRLDRAAATARSWAAPPARATLATRRARVRRRRASSSIPSTGRIAAPARAAGRQRRGPAVRPARPHRLNSPRCSEVPIASLIVSSPTRRSGAGRRHEVGRPPRRRLRVPLLAAEHSRPPQAAAPARRPALHRRRRRSIGWPDWSTPERVLVGDRRGARPAAAGGASTCRRPTSSSSRARPRPGPPWSGPRTRRYRRDPDAEVLSLHADWMIGDAEGFRQTAALALDSARTHRPPGHGRHRADPPRDRLRLHRAG